MHFSSNGILGANVLTERPYIKNSQKLIKNSSRQNLPEKPIL